jgi:hypothetical protein
MSRLSDGTMYAVALRAPDGLWLLARIRRSKAGDVYYLIPRDDPEWNPHARDSGNALAGDGLAR